MMRHKSTETFLGPVTGKDLRLDEAILRNDVVVTGTITLPAPGLAWPHGPKVAKGKVPELYRLCRTKGVTYRRYPDGRDRKEWRAIERQLAA